MLILSVIKRLLTYEKPKSTEDFELIENETGKPVEERKKNNTKQYKTGKMSKDNNISKDLQANVQRFNLEFNVPENLDVVIREFKIAHSINAFILFIEGMVDKNIINDYILRQLMAIESFQYPLQDCAVDYILDNVLSINRVSKVKEYGKIIKLVLGGVTALFIDGCDECVIIESQGYEKRNVEKPVTERVIKGSHEGFTENLRTNITLIRKIIRNKNLITEVISVDETNKTNCAVLYIKGIVNPELLKEVKRRISLLNIDFISGSGMLEELISDHTMMPFAQILMTERPDRAASYIMDGKVILVIEGSPYVSSIPSTFFEALQSPEDFSLKWQFATFLRYLRLFAYLEAILLPGLYTAIILFHQEMIPTELLNSIVKSRENVPFPTIVEILIMEISFELIREGGIRVPGIIGNTLGIVGALILGQAAVQAQLVSPVLMIVIAMVGISSFAIPSYSTTFELRLLRFVFILFGAVLGFYGITTAVVIVFGLACSYKSFGVPYLTPVAPKTKSNPDVIAAMPAYMQKYRPDYTNALNRRKSGRIIKKWTKQNGGEKN